jgi:molybdopterin biosynthesis enzyme MoaB
VTIAGAEFTGATAVQFNGVAASTFTVDSNTQIRATVSASATTGKISVVTSGGTANSVDDFTVASGGTFTERHVPLYDAYVRLSTPTSNYGVVTGIRLRKSSGDDLDSYLKFVVANINGPVVSAKLRLAVTNASTDGGGVYAVSNFYKNTTTAWTQSGLNWNNAPVISGSPLSSVSSVAIGNIAEFDVTAAITGNGTFSFGLSNNSSDDVHYSSQEGATKPELLVEYSTGAPVAPTISSFSPASGPVGTEVTVAGSNFSGATSVKFNGVSASTFSIDSATQIRANVPSGATTGKVSVTTAGGTGASAADFTVTAPPSPPTIASFTPASGVVGIEVTITGTNFTGATSVQFNGTSASTFNVDSATQLRANVPSGATTGKISVTTAGGAAQSSADFTVTGGGTVTLTFNPGEDSYVQLTTPTTNYGSNSGLRARKTSTEEQRSYLKFSLSGITGSVVSATLRLKVTNASDIGGSIYKVSNNYVGTSTSWVDEVINWNNAPVVSGSPLSSVGAVVVGNVAEFNVAAGITGNGQISFAITSTSSNDVQFNSSEGGVVPELVIVISSPSAAREGGFADGQAEALPTEYSLSQNYPNPFNGRTTIEYALPEPVQVRLAIYNSLGQMVRKLVDEEQSAGYKSETWDGTDEHGRAVGSGLYFYRLDAGSRRMNGRMILQQ